MSRGPKSVETELEMVSVVTEPEPEKPQHS
jgi:hypothetical protein